MKRVERKHLKEDEIVTGLNRFVHFVKSKEKELLMAGGALVVLALLFGAFQLIKVHSLKKESRMASEIMSLRTDLEKKPENLAKLEKLAGNGKFSRLAYVEMATYWLEKGDLDKAEAGLRKIKSGPKDILYYQAQDLLAQVFIKRKNFDQAMEVYKKIEAEKPKSYPLDAALFHKAQALELKGDIKAALETYKKLQQDFAQTYFGYEASIKSSKLENVK